MSDIDYTIIVNDDYVVSPYVPVSRSIMPVVQCIEGRCENGR